MIAIPVVRRFLGQKRKRKESAMSFGERGRHLQALHSALEYISTTSPIETIELPLRIVSLANSRAHWRSRAETVKLQRHAARLRTCHLAWSVDRKLKAGLVVVLLTRFAPRQLDSDNLASAFKAVRDGVADGLGLSGDGPASGVVWVYDQQPSKLQRVTIELFALPAGTL